MDASTVKAWVELATAFGVIALFAFLLIWVFVIKQRNDAIAQSRQDAFMKQMAGIVEGQIKNEANQLEHLDLIRQELSLLSKTVDNTSAAKQSTIDHNAKATETLQEIIRAQVQALIELRTDYLQKWDDSLKKMSGAQDRIITDINEHTDTQAALTTGAVIGAQQELTRQHTGQDAGVKALMEESEKRITQGVNENTNEQVAHNGDATRNLIVERLNSINERLDAMQLKAEQRDTQMAQQLHQLSADLSSTLLLITAPKAPPQIPPPVADVPKEELK